MPDTEDRPLEPGERPRRAVPHAAWYIGAIVVLAVAGSIAFPVLATDHQPSRSLSPSPISASPRGAAPCPSDEGGAIVEWVPFIRFYGRTYVSLNGTGSGTMDPSQRGRTIGAIRCTL